LQKLVLKTSPLEFIYGKLKQFRDFFMALRSKFFHVPQKILTIKAPLPDAACSIGEQIFVPRLQAMALRH
jgi:hypothetical protein